MSSGKDDLDVELARLGTATLALRPTAGFGERVMAAIQREAPVGMLDAIWASSRRMLPIAALAAAAAVVWAVQSQTTIDDALAVSYGSVELDE